MRNQKYIKNINLKNAPHLFEKSEFLAAPSQCTSIIVNDLNKVKNLKRGKTQFRYVKQLSKNISKLILSDKKKLKLKIESVGQI